MNICCAKEMLAFIIMLYIYKHAWLSQYGAMVNKRVSQVMVKISVQSSYPYTIDLVPD